ncbi:MAG: SDR family oxidoreductase [Myxococcota bacterium]|jgi:UDP-glucose 4-epimerase
MTREYVVITGICGNLGRLLARRLHKKELIIGIDRRSFPDRPKDVLHFQIDLRRKKAEEIFRGHKIKAVYHLGVMHDPRMAHAERYSWNVLGTTKVLEYCERFKIPRFVYLSSADVYGPSPGNSNFLPEDAPLQGWRDLGALRDVVETDMLVQSFFWKAKDTDIVILRPVHIVGPHVSNAPARYLNLARSPVALGFDPLVQLIHEDDVIDALASLVEKKVRGIFNLEGPGTIPLSAVLKAVNARTFPCPDFLLKPALGMMWKWKLTNFPPSEVDFLRYICTVDGTRARQELGFSAKKSLAETIAAIKKVRL